MGFDTDLYYPGSSIIHRFDARAKIIYLFFVFFIIFSIKTLVSIFIFCLFYGFIIFLSGVPPVKLFSGMKTWFLAIFTICIFPFFITPGSVVIRIGLVNITYEGIREGGFLFCKLFLTLMGAKILAVTTTIKQIVLVFPGDSGFIIIMSVGFVRSFVKEARQIFQSMLLRSGCLEIKNLIQAIVTRMYLIGLEIEESLQLYGYNQCGKKTSFYELKWKLIDWIPIMAVVFLSVLVYAGEHSAFSN